MLILNEPVRRDPQFFHVESHMYRHLLLLLLPKVPQTMIRQTLLLTPRLASNLMMALLLSTCNLILSFGLIKLLFFTHFPFWRRVDTMRIIIILAR
jgi:hypothetical protein